jgi:hypothetical protein
VCQKANEINSFLKKDFNNVAIKTGGRNHKQLLNPEHLLFAS